MGKTLTGMSKTLLKWLQITSSSLAEDNPLPAHWTGGVHGVFASQPPEAGLAEGVPTGEGPEGLVKQVEADRADQVGVHGI